MLDQIAAATAAQTSRWRMTFVGPVGAHEHDLHAAGGDGIGHCRRDVRRGADFGDRQAVHAPRARTRSMPCGVPNSGLEVLGQVGLREEREDAAAVVVDDDERGIDAAVARTEQAVAVVQEAEIAEQADGRTV